MNFRGRAFWQVFSVYAISFTQAPGDKARAQRAHKPQAAGNGARQPQPAPIAAIGKQARAEPHKRGAAWARQPGAGKHKAWGSCAPDRAHKHAGQKHNGAEASETHISAAKRTGAVDGAKQTAQRGAQKRKTSKADRETSKRKSPVRAPDAWK